MIEVNLLPDVKQEFIRAQRVRTTVVSFSILASLAAVGLVVLLSVYVFGVQGLRSWQADSSIDSEYGELSKVSDLSNALTVQQQLEVLPKQNDSKRISSRVFDILRTITPTGDNRVTVQSLSVNTEDALISISGEAENGYKALDVFKKTIEATKFQYRQDGESETSTVNLTEQVIDGQRSFGSSDGEKMLRFEISFTYPEELFSRTSTNGRVIAPDRRNATDSAVAVPESLFRNTDSGDDTGGEN